MCIILPPFNISRSSLNPNKDHSKKPLIILDPWMTIAGLAITMGAKLWFLDRMVWLFEDMIDQHEPYRRWLR